MKLKIFKLIVWLRNPISHILWWIVRCFLTVERPGKWNAIRSTSTAQQMSDLMSAINYKADPMMGVFDYTLYDLDLIFNEKKSWWWSCDCDDSAFAWFDWAVGHDYSAWQVALVDGTDIKSAHMVTVYQQPDGKYRLCNWQLYPVCFPALDVAIDEFRYEKLTVHGKYTDLMWAVYRKYQS